jgi:FtsH-binding integral membrane protein
MEPRFDNQAWVNATPAATVERERSFIRGAYGWMFAGLLLTALASAWVMVSPAMQALLFGNRAVFWILAIAEIGIVMFLSVRVMKMSPAAAASAFFVYSVLNGLTLSAIFFVYTQQSIVQAFLVASGMFGAMSVYGMVTKRDLTSWGSFFFMGLIGVIILSVVNIFMKSTGLGFVISVVGIFVFVGLTAYDTQKLKHLARVAEGPQATNLAVIGALALYLDFINLFLLLLRLFGSRRN